MSQNTENPAKQQKSIENFKALFRNTGRIFAILFRHMPWLFSSILVLTIIMGIIPIFSAKALGTLIDKIIEGVETSNVSAAYPALILFAILTAIPTVIRNIVSFIDRHLFLKMQDLFELITLRKRGSFDIAQYEDPKFQDRLQRAFNNGIYPFINVVDAQIQNLEIFCGIVVRS
jgi:ABC-type bacteriocin/lantibiotic exporter with double-glycine peptidase domain